MSIVPLEQNVEDVTFQCDRLGEFDGSDWHLESGRRVSIAAGCLPRPAAGDRVLVGIAGVEAFVVQVLARDETLPFVIERDEIEVVTSRRASIRSGGSIDFTARGALRTTVRDWFASVLDNHIHRAGQHVSHVDNSIMKVASLFRLSTTQALVDAKKDRRPDAERIRMG